MNLVQSKKSVWLSGEVCQVSGTYFADTCGHETQKVFTRNDIFTRCAVCHRSVRWIRSDRQTFDAQQTLSFDKRTDFNFSNVPGKKF